MVKLEEIPNSTPRVKRFSNGNMLLTLWFDGSNCKSMEVVFDMLSGTSVLFCSNKISHYYHPANEVRYGYELSEIAAKFTKIPQEKIETLKSSISNLNATLRDFVLSFLKSI